MHASLSNTVCHVLEVLDALIAETSEEETAQFLSHQLCPKRQIGGGRQYSRLGAQRPLDPSRRHHGQIEEVRCYYMSILLYTARSADLVSIATQITTRTRRLTAMASRSPRATGPCR